MKRIGWFLLALNVAAAFPNAAGAEEAAEPRLDPAAAAFLAASEPGEGEAPAPSAPAPAGEAPDEGAEAFLSGTEQPEIEAPVEEEGLGWAEPADMRFWMVGARYRTIFVPGWLLNLFFDFPQWPNDETAGPFMANQAAGVEFTTRRNNFSITGAVWWAGYFSSEIGQSYRPRTFVANEQGDPDDPEFIESTISLLLFTADFVFSTMFTDWFGITYGAGFGLGVKVGGGLIRTEAYPDRSAPTGFTPCSGPNDPADPGGFCEARGGVDDGYYGTEDSRVWPIYPWVNILLGLRFKAFRHLEINVDGGIGIGFLMGFRVNYIF